LTPEQGRLRIDLKGELAGILALAAGEKKKPGFEGRALAEQINLVAGRGFEPLTFRL
jgi:site-specific DNA recombinase